MVARAARAGGGRGVLDTEFPQTPKFDHLPAESAPQGVTAFLSVQEGCDKFCTFCVVPYTRGAEFSRPVGQIMDEARRLIDQGAREITLLGQNVNAWHGADERGRAIGLGGLIRRLAGLDGLQRIRYTTSHPRDMDDDLIAAHGEVGALMPYLHLPAQSGSDRVLAAMNRRHAADDYLRIVDRLRDSRPDLALSADFIVGFPGESEADFEATLALVRAVGYAQAYSFKYSARPGTPAAALDTQVAEEVKEARLAALQALLDEQQAAFNAATVGRRVGVLFDRPGRHAGQLAGRTPHNQAVHAVADDALHGTVVPVDIAAVERHSLTGSVVAPAACVGAGVPMRDKQGIGA
jgi:tRNA-2-methylthio-N6-dimethylallyladenosine synthase